MTNFAQRFLNKVGCQQNQDNRARNGQLPEYLSPWEIAGLAGAGSAATDNYMRQIILDACKRGVIKARPAEDFYFEKDEAVDPTLRVFIHKDDARRYFQSLDVMPSEGTPLWFWLRGKTENEAKQLRPDQQDKADFQQKCLERWKVSPTIPITGPEGIAAREAGGYARVYKPATLEKWAREVAPVGVKGKRGRRRKISADPEK